MTYGFSSAALLRQRLRAGARYVDNEPRTMPQLALDRDPAAVALHDQLDHVEAEAETGDRLRRGGALERLENPVLHCGIDAGPTVDDLEPGEVGRVIMEHANLDRLAGAVLDRVRKQVRDDLLESQRIEPRVDTSVGEDLDPMRPVAL